MVVCPCPGACFQTMSLGWPWPFYDRLKFVPDASVELIEHWGLLYFQICSNSAYPQHSGERYSTNGPLVIIVPERKCNVADNVAQDSLVGRLGGGADNPIRPEFGLFWNLYPVLVPCKFDKYTCSPSKMKSSRSRNGLSLLTVGNFFLSSGMPHSLSDLT